MAYDDAQHDQADPVTEDQREAFDEGYRRGHATGREAVRWILWARDLRGTDACPVSLTDKAVLMVLATYANAAGECFPSQETIAADACMTDRRVRSSLKALEARGAVARSKRGRCTLYTLTPDGASAFQDGASGVRTPAVTTPDGESGIQDGASGIRATPDGASAVEAPNTGRRVRRTTSSSTTSSSGSRAREQDEIRLLEIVERWTTQGEGRPTWPATTPEDVLEWWRARASTWGLDLAGRLDQLTRWASWLEAHALTPPGSGPTFPRVWQNALDRWMRNGRRYTEAEGEHRRRGVPAGGRTSRFPTHYQEDGDDDRPFGEP